MDTDEEADLYVDVNYADAGVLHSDNGELYTGDDKYDNTPILHSNEATSQDSDDESIEVDQYLRNTDEDSASEVASRTSSDEAIEVEETIFDQQELSQSFASTPRAQLHPLEPNSDAAVFEIEVAQSYAAPPHSQHLASRSESIGDVRNFNWRPFADSPQDTGSAEETGINGTVQVFERFDLPHDGQAHAANHPPRKRNVRGFTDCHPSL